MKGFVIFAVVVSLFSAYYSLSLWSDQLDWKEQVRQENELQTYQIEEVSENVNRVTALCTKERNESNGGN